MLKSAVYAPGYPPSSPPGSVQLVGRLGLSVAAVEQPPRPAAAGTRLSVPQFHVQLAAEGADDGAVTAERQLKVKAAVQSRPCALSHRLSDVQHAPTER